MAGYYGFRLKFYCTASGPRAVFQGATVSDMSTWTDISEEYAPDSTADPESVGATVSASGISLPTGSMTVNKPSEAQRWVWLLDGNGNIPITIDPTTKGVLTVSTEITWPSGHDDGMVGFWVGDAAPTLSAGGVAFFVRQTTSPNFNAERSYNDSSNSLFISLEPDLTYGDMILNYCANVIEETIISSYDSTLTFVDTTHTSTDLGISTPAFALLAGHASTATTVVTTNPIAYIYWSEASFDVTIGSSDTARASDYYNALLIQDSRLVTATISAAYSDYTESDRKPGFAIPADSSAKLLPSTAGSQDDMSYDIYIKNGGFVGDAGFLWREQNETTYGYLGQESQTLAQRGIVIDAFYEPYHPCSVTTKTGRVVVAYGTTSTVLIRTAYYDGGAGFDGLQTVITSGQDYYLERTDTNAGTTYAGCCMLYDEKNDEILLFVRAIFQETSSLRFVQIWTYSSTDNGVTFSLKSKNTIKNHDYFLGLTFDDHRYERMGAIWVGDAIILFLNAFYDNSSDEAYIIISLSSYDYGVTFNFISETSDDVYDISCAGNTILYRHPTSVSVLKYKRFYAVKDWSAVDAETLDTGGSFKGTDFGLLQKRSGSYSLIAGASGDAADWDSTSDRWGQDTRLYQDIFNTTIDYTLSSVISTGDGSVAFTQMCLAEFQGALLLFYKLVGSTLGGEFNAVFLGGYTNVSIPNIFVESSWSFPIPTTTARSIPATFGADLAAGIDAFSTYPIDAVPSSIWTASGTDTLSITNSNYHHYFSITASGASPGKYYTHAVSGGASKLTIEAELGRSSCTLAGAGSRGAGIEINYDNASTTSVRLFLEAYKSGADYKYVLKNIHASTSLYTGDYGANTALKFRIAFWGQKVRLYVAENTVDNYNTIMQWTLVYSSDAVSMGTPSSATFDLAWGIYSASAAEIFKLGYINFIADTGGEWDLSDIDDIDGSVTDYRYPIRTTGKEKLLTSSLLLKWSGGPGKIGDSYVLSPSYTYPVDNIDVLKNPSKELMYYNDDDANVVEIVYNPEDGAPIEWETPNFGTYLEKPNFKTAYVQGRLTAVSSWETILTINTCNGFDGLTYTCATASSKYSAGLKPASGTTAGDRPIQHGELVGGYVICDNGVDTAVFPIRHNTEGVWAGVSVSSKKCIIYVDDWDNAFGTGTLSIIFPQHLLILPDFTDNYMHFRFRIPAQQTYEGKIGLSKCMIGPVYLFPREASFGRTVSKAHNYKLTSSQDGRRFAKQLGGPRKKMSLSWAELAGDDLHLLLKGEPAYVTLTDGGEAVGFKDSFPHLLEGVFDQLQGGVKTCVLALSLPFDVTPIQFNDPKSMLRGRIVSEYQRNANLGTENIDEYWAINTLEVEGEN